MKNVAAAVGWTKAHEVRAATAGQSFWRPAAREGTAISRLQCLGVRLHDPGKLGRLRWWNFTANFSRCLLYRYDERQRYCYRLRRFCLFGRIVCYLFHIVSNFLVGNGPPVSQHRAATSFHRKPTVLQPCVKLNRYG